MKYTLIRLKFIDPLHISSPRDDYSRTETIINSDTMVAAVMQVASMIGENEIITNTPQYSFSSLFPYQQDLESNQFMYFFPKPLGSLLPRNYDESKLVKKIQYIEKSLFEKLLEGADILDLGNKDTFFYPSNDNSRDVTVFSKQVFIRNRVPRADIQGGAKLDTEVYYTERIFFQENAGLFFLMATETEKIKNKILKVLKLLQTEGLGTDRHVGNGQFTIEYEEVDWFKDLESMETGQVLSLSMFLPENHDVLNEMLGNNARYELKNRGGWITNYPYLTLRKRNIKMFVAGSVFNKPQKIKYNGFGHTADITPENNVLPDKFKSIHPIFRSGNALFINCHL